MNNQPKVNENLSKEAEQLFINELQKHSSNFSEVKIGTAFPDSFPFDSFPIKNLSEHVMYHAMKTPWESWLDSKYQNINVSENLFFVEGANWGEWDAFGERTRIAFRESVGAYFKFFNVIMNDVILNIADELAEMIKDKATDELRLSNKKRDYQLIIINTSLNQLKLLAKNFFALIKPFLAAQKMKEKIESFTARTIQFKSISKEIIYTPGREDIKPINKIITESNRLINDSNELENLKLDSQNNVSELFLSYENDIISLTLQKIPTAENIVLATNFNSDSFSQEIASQIKFLKELTYMARKEKESYESQQMNKSLFRLQIIMIVTLFTSLAALFSISLSQIINNWLIFLIILTISVILAMGTYFFISRK